MEKSRDKYDQNTLYVCKKFSNDKNTFQNKRTPFFSDEFAFLKPYHTTFLLLMFSSPNRYKGSSCIIFPCGLSACSRRL